MLLFDLYSAATSDRSDKFEILCSKFFFVRLFWRFLNKHLFWAVHFFRLVEFTAVLIIQFYFTYTSYSGVLPMSISMNLDKMAAFNLTQVFNTGAYGRRLSR